MLTVIGLGSAGCNIAEKFESVKDVQVLLIDSNIEGENCFSLPVFNSPEDYENKLPSLKKFFINTRDKILLIMSGSGNVSGACLKILEYLKQKDIYVFYIKPDLSLLSVNKQMQDRLTWNVLQEYARSGMFKKIYLSSNTNIENLHGSIPIIGYYEILNETIFNAINFLFFYKDQKSIFENYSPPLDISRISTIGVYNLEEDEEKMFFDLDFIDDKCYYFVLNETLLKNDGKLFKTIKEKIKEKLLNNIKISYKIYSTDSKINYCYVVANTKKVQE